MMRHGWTARASALLVCAWMTMGIAGCGGAQNRPGPHQALSSKQQRALKLTQGGQRATIAIVDGGVDTSHPSLRGVVHRSWVAPGLDSSPTLHATQLAGIVAGRPTKDFSGGLAPAAHLLDAKALAADGTGLPMDIARALLWAGEQGADVVLASFGLENDEPSVRHAIAALRGRGIVVVAATGNGFGAFDLYPAKYPDVLGITAYTSRGERLGMANWRNADLAAPGERIWAPTLGDGYAPVSGTSVATAVGTALVAACGDHRSIGADKDQVGPAWQDGWLSTPENRVPKIACPELATAAEDTDKEPR